MSGCLPGYRATDTMGSPILPTVHRERKPKFVKPGNHGNVVNTMTFFTKQRKSKEVDCKLVEIPPPREVTSVKDRWVINKSDRRLNEREHTLLRNGLEFAVARTSLSIDE